MNERKNIPVFSGVLMYFPNAIQYVARVSKAGNEQHHPGEPLHWDMSKSTDEADALIRHALDMGKDGTGLDSDGILHAGKVAWRALANLERVLLATQGGDKNVAQDALHGTIKGTGDQSPITI